MNETWRFVELRTEWVRGQERISVAEDGTFWRFGEPHTAGGYLTLADAQCGGASILDAMRRAVATLTRMMRTEADISGAIAQVEAAIDRHDQQGERQ